MYRAIQNELSRLILSRLSPSKTEKCMHIKISILDDENHSWRNKNAHIRESCVSGRVLNKMDGMKINVLRPDSKEKLMCTHFSVFDGDRLLRITAQFVLNGSVHTVKARD